MKILSWNIERLKINENEELNFIKKLVSSENPDLIFLTETNLLVDFGTEYFSIHSTELPKIHDGQKYVEKENRISIFSKYSFAEIIKT